MWMDSVLRNEIDNKIMFDQWWINSINDKEVARNNFRIHQMSKEKRCAKYRFEVRLSRLAFCNLNVFHLIIKLKM